MPWREATPVELRRQFMLELLRGRRTFAELCARFGISQKTGFKWKARYRAEGPAGLKDKSRAPRSNSRRLSGEVEKRLLALKAEAPTWGPKKVRWAYSQAFPGEVVPAASTIGDFLKREGLVKARQRRPRLPMRAPSPFAPVEGPNDVWCIDFKGQFRLGDGRLCYPLTVTDAFSRRVLLVRAYHAIEMGEVKRALTGVFRRYGLPLRMRSDNGSPFGSVGLGGLTQLSAWWLSLGVQPEFITPGKPQQNGRHERMHLTLKQECTQPPEASLAAQQRVFDAWVRYFNEVRPHEALGMATPDSRYQPSSRPMPSRSLSPSYEAHCEVRRVRPNGCVRWEGGELYVSAALVHRDVAFEPQGPGRWMLRYYGLNLGLLDDKGMRVLQSHPPLRPSPMSPV